MRFGELPGLYTGHTPPDKEMPTDFRVGLVACSQRLNLFIHSVCVTQYTTAVSFIFCK